MSSLTTYRILIVDDTPSIHDDLRKVLAPANERSAQVQDLADAIFGAPAETAVAARQFQIDSAYQGQEALPMVEEAIVDGRPYSVAFVDMRMPPGWDGLETIERLWAIDPHLQIVICTAYSDHSWSTITSRLKQSDSFLILKKPFDNVEALQLANALCKKWDIDRLNRSHIANLDIAIAERTSQLREAEIVFGQAFSASPIAQAIVSLDPLEVLEVNRAFLEPEPLTHAWLCDTIRNLPDSQSGRPSPYSLVVRLGSGELHDEVPVVYTSPAGKCRHFRCAGRPIVIKGRPCAIWMLRDVTQKRELMQQLRQSQKLEAIGQLATGVAHDFNNLLTVIGGYSAEALRVNPSPEIKLMIEQVQTAADRAAALTRQLLVFTRKDAAQKVQISLAPLVQSLSPMLRRLIGSNIELDWQIAPNLPVFIADPSNIEQVIVNLVVNARDAMPNGGAVRVNAALRSIVDLDSFPTLPCPGEYIELTVTDTGTGIAPDLLPHIFDPFFTTKEAGKGTGLGLATVQSIVTDHQGALTVQSTVGRGTTFTILLPAGAAPGGGPPTPPLAPESDAPLPFKRVLLVEDDPFVLATLTLILRRRKIPYDVAYDAQDAFRQFEATAQPHDLVIADIVLPDSVNGLEIARTLRRQRPNTALILISGIASRLPSADVLRTLPGPAPKLLVKPFLPQVLIAAMREVATPPTPTT